MGIVELDGIRWNHGAAWFSIGVGDPRQQGQGIGAEAGALTLEFALRELNLHRVSSTVFAYNLPSQALM
ncbi:MAG: GNAT family N-acetyltransferase, partial [Chloroflexi bacterium]|nr:GNAT family N-acetyltransferase [Chloroflexota bacterium]